MDNRDRREKITTTHGPGGAVQVPGPDTRVVELRVHGIFGTSGDALVDSVASVDVAGDGIGRIIRPADRLRRPVPGPMLSAGERTVPRIVEGYVWGGMTSGGWAKATWALLFPFALANMAHWMLPPPRPDNVVGRALSGVLRALVRLAALLLTMLFVAQLTVVSLDLFAAQCLNPTATCMGFVPGTLRELDIVRASVALIPVGLIVLMMHRLSTVSWQVSVGKAESSHHSAQAPILPGANVVSDPDTPSLRALHVIGALSTVALVGLGGPFGGSADPRWLLAAALLVIAVLGTAVMDDPIGMKARRGSGVLRTVLSKTPRRVLLSLGSLLVVTVAVLPPALNGPLPGSGDTIDSITALLLLTWVAVAVLLIPAALLARQGWTSMAPRLRPWAGGWMAAPILLLACLLGDGFGAGLALSLRQALGEPGLMLPTAYDDVTIFWGTGTAMLLLGCLVFVPWALLVRWRASRADQAVPAEIALLHAGRQQDQRRAAKAWQWAELQRRYSHHALLLAAAILAATTGMSLLLRVVDMPRVNWFQWLSGLGVATLAALAIGLLRMVYQAAQEPKTARYLGILCDLTLFWPREAHPVVPPCYALKVIPELAARAAEHLAEPDTRVVIVGHSQGSLLAAVATTRLLESLPEEDRERVGLVTAGSQLQWAYQRAFPGVVPHDSLRDLAGALGGRWRSLCRGTDPIGGAVTTWNRQVYDGMLIGVGFRTDGTEGPLPAATRGPTGALVLGGDHWLPDPQRGPFSFRRWVPGVLGHTDYSGDPEWDRAVAMAAGLEIPVRGASLPLRTPTTTSVSASRISESAPRAAETAQLHPHGSDGGSLSDPADDWSGERSDVYGEQEESVEDNVEPVEVEEPAPQPADKTPEQGENARPQPAELPEITEPRGRTAPWERAVALRPSER